MSSGSEWVCGRRPVLETFQAGRRNLHKLWIAKETRGEAIDQILQQARERGVTIEWTSLAGLDRMVRQHHQGVAVQVSGAPAAELEPFLKELDPAASVTCLALDEIQDPQNVGAILRSAGFFGVQAVVMPRWRSAPVSGTAIRVSSGAAEHVTLIRIPNLVQAIDAFKDAGFAVVGADAEGGPAWKYVRNKRTLLVVGNEEKGLRRLVREHCDRLIGIPPPAAVGSLNVGAATAILLYELHRPR